MSIVRSVAAAAFMAVFFSSGSVFAAPVAAPAAPAAPAAAGAAQPVAFDRYDLTIPLQLSGLAPEVTAVVVKCGLFTTLEHNFQPQLAQQFLGGVTGAVQEVAVANGVVNNPSYSISVDTTGVSDQSKAAIRQYGCGLFLKTRATQVYAGGNDPLARARDGSEKRVWITGVVPRQQ